MGDGSRRAVTEAFMDEVAGAFAFLVERLDYTLVTRREPSACHAAPFYVLTYTNRARDRRVELHVQLHANEWIHHHGALMRLADGVAPGFFDNESYLSLTRVLAYYGHLDGLALEASEVQQRLRFYADVLRKHDECLQSGHWFDRDTLIEKERELYVLPFDREPAPWIDEAIAFFQQLVAGARVEVTLNSNSLPPWEPCGEVVALRCPERALDVRLTFGYGAGVDYREAAYTIRLRLGDRELERTSGEPLPILLDEIRFELGPQAR